MADSEAPFVEHENLSAAWGRALELALGSGRERAPLVVSITGFDHGVPREHPQIRSAMDAFLAGCGGWPIETVANTIFPVHQWNPSRPRADLYARYELTYRRLRRLRETRDGTYFGRMVARDREPRNQLERVLASYLDGTRRRSKLQISIFDPETDHSGAPYQGFPCMQHVVFSPAKGGDGLSVTAFYAVQYLVQRAYGNYLGLCRLGQFVAHELGRKLVRVTCVAGIGQVESKVGRQSVTLPSLARVREAVVEALGPHTPPE
jgi:hypothetical protein